MPIRGTGQRHRFPPGLARPGGGHYHDPVREPCSCPVQPHARRHVMLLGLALLYVGAVLFLNGLWLIDRIGDREIWVINVFSGGLTLLIALYLAFGPGATLDSVRGAGLTLLFTFTYFWVAINRFTGADGRGLGWFSLFVAITAVPVAYTTLAGSGGQLWPIWFGLSW